MFSWKYEQFISFSNWNWDYSLKPRFILLFMSVSNHTLMYVQDHSHNLQYKSSSYTYEQVLHVEKVNVISRCEIHYDSICLQYTFIVIKLHSCYMPQNWSHKIKFEYLLSLTNVVLFMSLCHKCEIYLFFLLLFFQPLLSTGQASNRIHGKINMGSDTLALLDGHWDQEIYFKDRQLRVSV